MDKNQLPYGNKISEDFYARLLTGCEILGIQPAWLMLAMAIETAKTFRASIQNPMSKATGLIQFMPLTAKELGTTIKELASMNEVEQLDYVFQYLDRYKGKMKTFDDVYLAIFYPAAIGKPDSYMFGASPEMVKKIALQNSGYDLNKDQAICKGEVKVSIRKFIPKVYEKLF